VGQGPPRQDAIDKREVEREREREREREGEIDNEIELAALLPNEIRESSRTVERLPGTRKDTEHTLGVVHQDSWRGLMYCTRGLWRESGSTPSLRG
jgi:hypothetical protein